MGVSGAEIASSNTTRKSEFTKITGPKGKKTGGGSSGKTSTGTLPMMPIDKHSPIYLHIAHEFCQAPVRKCDIHAGIATMYSRRSRHYEFVAATDSSPPRGGFKANHEDRRKIAGRVTGKSIWTDNMAAATGTARRKASPSEPRNLAPAAC